MIEHADHDGGQPERKAEVEIVNPAAEDVNARPARMALETDHPEHGRFRTVGPVLAGGRP